MEAVIVMPLYMLLFGGMMLVGDMVLGGVNLYNTNRMLAWIVNDRFTADDSLLIEQVKKRFDDSPWSYNDPNRQQRYWAKIPKGTTQSNSTGNSNSTVDKYVTYNNYLSLYKGSMPLKLTEIPLLYRGLLAVNDVMNRPDEVKAENEDLLYKTVFDLGKDEWFAHYLVKRTGQAADRQVSTAELVLSNSWIDIINDNWIKNGATNTGQVSTNINTDDLAGYTRGLEMFAGAEE